MNVIKLTNSQLATLLTCLDCYAKHLEHSLFVADCQQMYGSATALMAQIEEQTTKEPK